MKRSLIVVLVFFTLSVLASAAGDGGADVYIVYMEPPLEGDKGGPEAYHIRTLASVLGSEEAAREALVYSYKHAASGFSAKLTPKQVSELSKQPGVLQVVPERVYQLDPGPERLRRIDNM
ncbi:Tripeptidyl-peptidase II protein [Dioscorea alata]|uniref:Tripeptidyl-peptidase II protein n=1 Tax=Dioscorea alata TaxID=55571 RepID=A0ACB7VBY0_DIOAL|nr:Tripeptidyl-peptidase II protein [Dioscorea alata]